MNPPQPPDGFRVMVPPRPVSSHPDSTMSRIMMMVSGSVTVRESTIIQPLSSTMHTKNCPAHRSLRIRSLLRWDQAMPYPLLMLVLPPMGSSVTEPSHTLLQLSMMSCSGVIMISGVSGTSKNTVSRQELGSPTTTKLAPDMRLSLVLLRPSKSKLPPFHP